ncbi:MAG: hypothetical protein JXR64_07905, partial [Spirochaetales bacterium]|nr:hypothetical protein [Spirochaetales bacterium]
FEIKSPEDIPPLFINHFTILENDYIVKIPVDIERRNAKPGMDLYRLIIILRDDLILFLENNKGYVEKKELEYNNIISIKNNNNLLTANIELYTFTGIVEFEYNVVSQKIVDKIRDAIRGKIIHSQTTKIDFKEITLSADLSYFMNNLLKKISKNEIFKIIGFQDLKRLKRRKTNLVNIIKDSILKPYKNSILFLTNCREVVIISVTKDYEYSHIFIPIENISSIIQVENFQYINTNNMRIQFGDNSHQLLVDSDNPLKYP